VSRRLALRCADGPLAEEVLRARLADAFPAGFEEERDADVALVAWVYADVPPEGVEVWRSEPVAAGWEDRWRDFHHGVEIAGRLWVGPPWEAPPAGPAPIVIDPGRAFGTGAHATTRLALELLCALPAGGAALDLGCGSGVLALAAARLGFSPVLACDDDPAAIEATRANAAANGIALECFLADARRDPLPPAPLWLANILAEPLRAILRRTDAPARAIVSGLLAAEPFEVPGVRAARRLELDGWQALLLERA
jgi:ribosomal protein L11 methyltransferase